MDKILAANRGDMDYGVQFVGQSLGLIDEVKSVESIVQDMLAEASEMHRENCARLGPSDQCARFSSL